MRRASLVDFELDLDHRGYAFLESGATPTGGILLPLLTAGQVLMNVVIALIIMRLVTAFYAALSDLEDQENSSVVSIYWANFFLAFLANAVLILGNVVLYLGINIISNISPNALTYRIISDGTTLGLVLLELIVAIATPKNDKLYIPFIISHFICFCQCCKCCGNGSGLAFLRKSIHTLAIWVLMIFLQLVAASIVPVIIVCLRNPVPSIAFVTLMASTFFCLIIFIAHLIHISEHMKDSTSQERFTLILQAFVFLVFFGIVSLVIIVYLSFVRAGTSTGTLAGIFFSLVPSAIISGVAWYTKRNLLNSGSKKPKRVGSSITKYAGAFHKFLQGEDEELSQRESIPLDKRVNGETRFLAMENGNSVPMEEVTKLVEETTLHISPAVEDTKVDIAESDAVTLDRDVEDAKPSDETCTEELQNDTSNVYIEFERSPEGSGTIVSDQELTSDLAVTSNAEKVIDASDH